MLAPHHTSGCRDFPSHVMAVETSCQRTLKHLGSWDSDTLAGRVRLGKLIASYTEFLIQLAEVLEAEELCKKGYGSLSPRRETVQRGKGSLRGARFISM